MADPISVAGTAVGGFGLFFQLLDGAVKGKTVMLPCSLAQLMVAEVLNLFSMLSTCLKIAKDIVHG